MATRHEREEAEVGDYAGKPEIRSFLGWPIFGGWLPMVAFFDVPCEADGSPWDGEADPGWRVSILAAGWVNYGFSVRWAPPRPIRVLRQDDR